MDKVRITEEALDKIKYWVDKCPKEISGLGIVEVEEEEVTEGYGINAKTIKVKIPVVKDVYLLEQENTASTTDIEPEAVNKLLYKAIKDGYRGELKFWWHSHVNMDCFWSGTDMSTIETLSKNGWFIHGVFNKKGEYRCAFSDYSLKNDYIGLRYKVFNDEIPLEYIPKEEKDEELLALTYQLEEITKQIEARQGKLNELLDKEYEDNVKIKKWSYGGYKSGNYYNGGSNYKGGKTIYNDSYHPYWDDFDTGYASKHENKKKNGGIRVLDFSDEQDEINQAIVNQLNRDDEAKKKQQHWKKDRPVNEYNWDYWDDAYYYNAAFCETTTKYGLTIMEKLEQMDKFYQDDWDIYYDEYFEDYIFTSYEKDEILEIYNKRHKEYTDEKKKEVADGNK